MATKLKGLHIRKVDFVDNGANPDAHVALFKRAGEMPVKKTGAATFAEGMRERRTSRIRDEMWDICYALNNSLCSIINDDEVTNTAELMKESLNQFTETMTTCIQQWSAGNIINTVHKSADAPTDEEMQIARECRKRLDNILAITNGCEEKTETNVEDGEIVKGEASMIDKNLMTPAERAFFEDIEKRYSVQKPPTKKDDTKGKKTSDEEDEDDEDPRKGVKKSMDGSEDIYADLHPAVAAELKALKKRAEDADNRELTEIAKKYEIIGKKPEDLVPVLKSLRDAGGAAYDEMIGILDASVEAVNKSSMFTEIGKSGGYGAEPDAWMQIEKKADEIAATNPNMSRASAIDLACQQNPNLVHEYENGR